MLSRILRRLRSIVGRDRVERELDAEMRYHIDRETEANVERGMSPEEARRAALVAFGGVESHMEGCREATGIMLAESVAQDVRYGLRTLRRNPGYAIVVVLVLALGIGANAAIFSVVYGVLLKPLPYADGGQLVVLEHSKPLAGRDSMAFSPLEVEDVRAQSHTLAAVAEYHTMSFTLLGGAEPERVKTAVVSAQYFDLLGVRPALGRTFVAADDEPGADAVLVLSDRYWKTYLGGDPNVVGRNFEMNDRVHTVVGVLPPLPLFPADNDVYMCTSACPFRSSPTVANDRKAAMVQAIGRLEPGATVEQGAADMAAIAARFRADYPNQYPESSGYVAGLRPIAEVLTSKARPTLLVLFATAGLVLLLACANVANLALARTARRDRELAVRAALGAGRGRLVRQLVTESLVLAACGGVIGLVLARCSLDLLVAFAARFTPRAGEIEMDWRVLAFTLVASVASGVLFGAMPALSARANLMGVLRGATASAAMGAGGRLRASLIVAQVGIAFVLLIMAGLMLRSLLNLQNVDPGFDAGHVVSLNVPLNWTKYTEDEQARQFFGRLLARLGENPSYTSMGLTTGVPLSGARPWTQAIHVEGMDEAANPPQPVNFAVVSEDYFKTMNIPVVAGRPFDGSDRPEAPLAAIVSRATARRYFGQNDPIGKRVSVDGKQWATVVGVVGDVKQQGLDAEAKDSLYYPFAQNPGGGTIMIRTTSDEASVARAVRSAVYEIDPGQPVTDVTTLDEVVQTSLAPSRLTATLLGIFAGLALAITAAGIAGVMALWVSQRRHELGVRIALGASRGDVLGLVLRQAMWLVGLGLAIGLLASLVLSRALAGLVFGVAPTDAATYAAVSLLLALVAAASCLTPARRATSIDPIDALRAE